MIITMTQIQDFIGIKDKPISVSQVNQKLWEDIEKFKKFYLLLVFLVNPGVPSLVLETYIQAKWREVMALGM